jgi:hypothetical protein
MVVEMKKIWIPQAIAIAMLVWALNRNNPYGYYVLLRWVCCGIFAYLAVLALERSKQDWVWTLGIIALIYNPIFSIHLTRGIWEAVNVVTAVLAGASIFVFGKGNSSPQS